MPLKSTDRHKKLASAVDRLLRKEGLNDSPHGFVSYLRNPENTIAMLDRMGWLRAKRDLNRH